MERTGWELGEKGWNKIVERRGWKLEENGVEYGEKEVCQLTYFDGDMNSQVDWYTELFDLPSCTEKKRKQ